MREVVVVGVVLSVYVVCIYAMPIYWTGIVRLCCLCLSRSCTNVLIGARRSEVALLLYITFLNLLYYSGSLIRSRGLELIFRFQDWPKHHHSKQYTCTTNTCVHTHARKFINTFIYMHMHIYKCTYPYTHIQTDNASRQ